MYTKDQAIHTKTEKLPKHLIMDNSIDSRNRANELIDLMKYGTLSIEQLKELVPMTTDFLKELCCALKEEIANSRQSHIEALQTLGKAIDVLRDIGKVENCSDDIKKAIIDRIGEISSTIRELQKIHEDNSSKRAWGVLSIIGAVAALIFLLSSNSNQKQT